jgi:hypothetical protein
MTSLEPRRPRRPLVRAWTVAGRSDPQARRKQGEQNDTARAVKCFEVLPGHLFKTQARFLAARDARTIHIRKSEIHSSDLELTVLTAMTGGELQVDAAQRVVRLEGHLGQDVDFGWASWADLIRADGW